MGAAAGRYGENINTKYWEQSLKATEDLENLDICVRILLKWILNNWIEECGTDASGLGQRPVGAFSKHGNKPSGLIHDGIFWI
jgi:hypothetical protein